MKVTLFAWSPETAMKPAQLVRRAKLGALTAFLLFLACDRAPGELSIGSRAAGLDSDSDGLDDAWETTYFGNLSQTGSGDFDSDGMTNLEEFTHGFIPNVDDGFEDEDGDRYPNVFELRRSGDPTDDQSLPTANYVVDVNGGGNYTTVSGAVTAANTSNGAYQIIAIEPGVYSGTGNINLSVASNKPRLLFIGTAGAATTIVDGSGANLGWTLNNGGVVASLTIRRTTRALYLNASAKEFRLVDLVFTDNASPSSSVGAVHLQRRSPACRRLHVSRQHDHERSSGADLPHQRYHRPHQHRGLGCLHRNDALQASNQRYAQRELQPGEGHDPLWHRQPVRQHGSEAEVRWAPAA